MQWNPDSYFVYRNIFDNLLTRDNADAIVPQIRVPRCLDERFPLTASPRGISIACHERAAR